MSLAFSGSHPQSPGLTFQATLSGASNSLDFTGRLLDSLDMPDGLILAALNPQADQSPTAGNFDFAGLPRLTSQPTLNLTTSVAEVNLTRTFDGLELGQYISGFSLSFPLSGMIEGYASLTGLPPDFLLAVGQRFQLTQSFSLPTEITDTFDASQITFDQSYPTFDNSSVSDSPLQSIEIASLYLLASPILAVEDSGYFSATLSLGDELALFNERARMRTRLYCGELPKTAQQAARIYAEYNGLFTRTFPAGHQLLDRDDQTFASESPYQYLQALYAPTNQDVRCKPSGGIIAFPRAGFNLAFSMPLSFQSTLEVDTQVAQSYVAIPRLRLSNQYEILETLQPRIEVSTIVSSLPSNVKPWFQSGHTITTLTTHFIGSTMVFQTKVLMGYVPDALVISDADYSEDQCDGVPIPSTWGLVSTTTFALGYYPHISGSFLASKAESWKVGKSYQASDRLPTSSSDFADDPRVWRRFDGNLEYELETYENTPQINSEVCRKDYIHLLTASRKEVYKLDSQFTYRLHDVSDIRFSPLTSNPQEAQTFQGFTQEWNKVVSEGSYSDTDKAFIIQPAVVTQDSPPGSNWVRPGLKSALVFTTILDSNVAQLEGIPEALEGPFCYTLSQLEVYGNRHLQENNSLAQSIEIAVAYFFPASLGQSIRYTNHLGDTSSYLVFNITITQSGPNSQKTLLLAKVS